MVSCSHVVQYYITHDTEDGFVGVVAIALLLMRVWKISAVDRQDEALLVLNFARH